MTSCPGALISRWRWGRWRRFLQVLPSTPCPTSAPPPQPTHKAPLLQELVTGEDAEALLVASELVAEGGQWPRGERPAWLEPCPKAKSTWFMAAWTLPKQVCRKQQRGLSLHCYGSAWRHKRQSIRDFHYKQGGNVGCRSLTACWESCARKWLAGATEPQHGADPAAAEPRGAPGQPATGNPE